MGRFSGLLAKGDAKARDIRAQNALHPRIDEGAHWLRWLEFLRDYSAHEHDYSNLPRTLIIHGQQDAIIPAMQGEELARKLGAKLHCLPNAGHAPHWHNPQALQKVIAEFLS